MSVNRTMSITSFPRVIPPYRCDEMAATSMRRIEKQMCAHPHVRLGHGSKDTAHVRVDTSFFVMQKYLRIRTKNFTNLDIDLLDCEYTKNRGSEKIEKRAVMDETNTVVSKVNK